MSKHPSPSISRRNGIAWSSNPMTEPTSVLVLGAPSNLFVDVRITLKKPIPGIPSDPNELPPKRSGPHPFQPGSDFAELEFANAGLATYSENDSTSGSTKKQGSWTHWCSTETSKDVRDTGELVVRSDGSVLETGAMPHPQTKKVTPYAEIWIDEKPEFAPQDVHTKKRSKGSFVLARCEDKDRHVRGMIAWVGRYCQGIVRHGDTVCVERWEFDEGGHGGRGEWVRTLKSGSGLPLPCGWVVKEEEALKVGVVLNVPDFEKIGAEWHVIETDFEWATT
jgi:hypothetical protein